MMPVAGDVEGATDVAADAVLEQRHQVVLVEELQARVVAEHGGGHRQPEVGGHRARHVPPDDVGAAEHRHPDVGAAAGEAAHVALDLGDVLGVAGARGAARLHVLGEHRGVTAAGAVDGARGLHDEVADARRLLAGGEELHRPDDVELLHRVASAGAAGGRDHAHVDDGVDVLLGDDLGDDRVADVGAHEGDVADVTARGSTSTPMTRRTEGSSAIARAQRRPRSRETPVTRTTEPPSTRFLEPPAMGAEVGPGITCRACAAARASS